MMIIEHVAIPSCLICGSSNCVWAVIINVGLALLVLPVQLVVFPDTPTHTHTHTQTRTYTATVFNLFVSTNEFVWLVF